MRTSRKRRPVDARKVEAGEVACPLVHDNVDVERCYSCGLLKRFDVTDGEMWVTCRVPDREPTLYVG